MARAKYCQNQKMSSTVENRNYNYFDKNKLSNYDFLH